MNREEWIQQASRTSLSERQAEALYRRQNGESRKEAAEAMDISPSNLDNAEREARSNIVRAHNLLALASGIDAGPEEYGAAIGTCAVCDTPTSSMTPHPDDDGPLEERRLVCSSCGEDLRGSETDE